VDLSPDLRQPVKGQNSANGGLDRRKFTKELKLAAIQRLQAGATAAEVVRAFGVTPKILYRWRDEFRRGPGNSFPGSGQRRWDETRGAQLERKVDSRRWRLIFLKVNSGVNLG
jgi:transposase-like protein